MNLWKTVIIYGLLCLLISGCTAKQPASHIETDKETETIETETSETETIETEQPHIKTASEKAAETLASMSTADKAGQLIMMAVRIYNGANFTEMNDEVKEMFAQYHFGGFCLFRENFTDDIGSAVRFNNDLQDAVSTNGGVPMLISTDQEGGSVYRLVTGTMTPGNMALASGGNPEFAYEAAKIIGEELSASGINADLAPVVDINANPSNPVIGIRSFSDDPFLAASFAREYVRGLNEENVAAALKHYPGHGDTDTDSHTGLPLINKTLEELKSSDLIPFADLVRDGYSDMIMSAHIQFPNIETGTYTSIADQRQIHLPATLSKTLLNDILREELGFEGVVITDSLIMDAIAAHFDPLDAAALALNAGADILLMPLDIRGSEDLPSVKKYMDGLISLIEEGTVPMERVNQSVQRILTLKYRRGLMEDDTQRTAEDAERIVGSSAHHEKETAIADETVTVVENNGVLPFHAEEGMKILLVGMNSNQANALGHAYNLLEAEGIIPQGIDAFVYNGNWTNSYGTVYQALEDTDLLILTESMYSPVLIDFAADSQLPAVIDLIDTAHSYDIPVAVISCALPYDLALLSDADALMAVYNQMGVMECDDSFQPIGTYSPNITGAMDVIFGKVSPHGKLPVNIPAVRNGTFEKDYVYQRGDGLTW